MRCILIINSLLAWNSCGPSLKRQQFDCGPSVEQQRFDQSMVEKCAERAEKAKAESQGLIKASAGHWNRSKHTCYVWVKTGISEEIFNGYEGYTIIWCTTTNPNGEQCTEHNYGKDGHVPSDIILERFKVYMEETNFNF